MKHGWIVFLFAACMVRVGTPFHLPPSDPDPEPAAQRASEPDPRGAPVGRSSGHYNERQIAVLVSYEQLHDLIARADQEAAAHQDDRAADAYQRAVEKADGLLEDVQRRPPPPGIIQTNSDGPLDDATLFARVREQRARAAELAKACRDRYRAALFAEFHPASAAQRDVLLDLGRPELTQQQGQTCWVYRDRGVVDTYCWTRAGQLAEHTVFDPQAEARARAAYYAAAAFGSGSCNFDCATRGWSRKIPSGQTVYSACSSSDCLRNGWTTMFPDGKAKTECKRYQDCTQGWVTVFPDGTRGVTSCEGSDCMKWGWTMTLSSGGKVRCSCRGNCPKEGARCG